MSVLRSIKRQMLKEQGKIVSKTCPKCHGELCEKPGYGTVCMVCGWSNMDGDENDD